MKDIEDRESVIRLVNLFYEKVRQDDLLSEIFQDVDWEHHLPIMYNFWSSILLGDLSYNGNPFQKHRDLLIQKKHFDRWLYLFQETVNQNFEGSKASEVIDRAKSIANLFQYKMGIMK